MNATERVSEKFHNHLEDSISNKDLMLAWLDFHHRKPGAHPDDYMDNEGVYTGWEVKLAEKMFELYDKKKVKDIVMYPHFAVNWTLEQLDGFHSNDEDDMMTEKIDTIRSFFEDLRLEELQSTLEALGDLISFHDGAPEDVFEHMSNMYEALHWIVTRA